MMTPFSMNSLMIKRMEEKLCNIFAEKAPIFNETFVFIVDGGLAD
jgi:hypothetical protein